MSNKTPIDIKKLLKTATLPERVVSIVLDRQLVAEFQRLEDELAKAHEARLRDPRLSNSVAAVAQKVEEVREKMRDSTVEFVLRGKQRDEWRALKAQHPIKNEEQASNVDRLMDADSKSLFNEAVPASLISPQLDDEDWANLIAVLTDGEWDRLVNAVYALNEDGTSIPFSRAASGALRPNADD